MTGQQALHLVSALATEAQLIPGQEACAEKSSELTAIPVRLEALLLKGRYRHHRCHGHPQHRSKDADYVLAVKDNQPKPAESIKTFFEIGQTEKLQPIGRRPANGNGAGPKSPGHRLNGHDFDRRPSA